MAQHRIIITGGGTGGHVSPALAVCEQLRNDSDVVILYVGGKGQFEEKLTDERNIDFVGLPVKGMPRRLSLQSLTWPIGLLQAIARAQEVFKKFDPTVVLGTGGYAAAPSLATAILHSIPYAIHEPDSHPGLVNKVFSRRANLVSLGMGGALDTFSNVPGKVVVNGNPVSQNFLSPKSRAEACSFFGLDPKLKTLLITGGSQGAKAINEAVIDALPTLLKSDNSIQIIHQVGSKNYEECKERAGDLLNHPKYCLRDYISDLSVAYACSDLAVCRAGAMTIAEITLMGVPAIFIPYPYAAQDHQSFNAKFVEGQGAAKCVYQDEITSQNLAGLVLELLADKDRLSKMSKAMRELGKPRAAADLANQVKSLSTNYLASKS